MEHKAARKKLSEYIDGVLADEERVAIDAHLEGCENCRDALEELRTTVGHIKETEEVEPPPWLASRIMAHVREEAAKKESWRRFFSPAVLRPVMSGVAIAFVAVVSLYIYQSTRPEVSFQEMPALPMEAPPADREEEQPAPEKGAVAMKPKAAPPRHFEAARERVAQERAAQDRAVEDLKRKDEAKAVAPSTTTTGAALSTPALAPAPAPVPEGRTQEPGAIAPSVPSAPAPRTAEEMDERFSVRQKTAAGSDSLAGVAAEKPAAQMARAAAPLRFSLQVKDPEITAAEIGKKIAGLGGTVTSSQTAEGKRTIRAQIPASKLPRLSRTISQLGRMTASPATNGYIEGNIEVLIVISLR